VRGHAAKPALRRTRTFLLVVLPGVRTLMSMTPAIVR
jgi:hypothetical protein